VLPLEQGVFEMTEHFHITMYRKLDDGREIECHSEIDPELLNEESIREIIKGMQDAADLRQKTIEP